MQDVSDPAITEAAQNFIRGDAFGQTNKTFAPSIAEFVQEARRIHEVIPYRTKSTLPAPKPLPHKYDDEKTRCRMGFKMKVLTAGIGMGRVDDVARANREGLEELVALGQQWGVPVPDELWEQLKKAA